jgi:hypothetical protein
MSTKLNGVTSETVISVFVVFGTPDHVTGSVIEPVLPDSTYSSRRRRRRRRRVRLSRGMKFTDVRNAELLSITMG